MRQINERSFVNRMVPVFDGVNRTMMAVAPQQVFKQLELATNGMQFSPNLV